MEVEEDDEKESDVEDGNEKEKYERIWCGNVNYRMGNRNGGMEKWSDVEMFRLWRRCGYYYCCYGCYREEVFNFLFIVLIYIVESLIGMIDWWI